MPITEANERTLRAMLGEGRSTHAAGRAIGVSGPAVQKWIRRETAAGRPVDRVAAKAGRRAAPKAKPPAPPSAPPPALPPDEPVDFDAIKTMDLEEQLKSLAHIARTAGRDSDRTTAHRVIADLRRKEAPPEDDGSKVPAELLALWNDPKVRPMLERVVAAQRGMLPA